jgi:hypothetical protein
MNFLHILQTCKLNNEKRKKYVLAKKKSFIGSATMVNFINVLQAAFTREDPKKHKNTVLFCAFGILGRAVASENFAIGEVCKMRTSPKSEPEIIQNFQIG